MQTHRDTDTQSALSDFSRLPNRIYADRMFFTFLKYSAEEYLHGLKRKRRRKFHIHTQQIWCYPMRWNAVSFFHSFSSLHRSLSPSFFAHIACIDLLIYIGVCYMCICRGLSVGIFSWQQCSHIHVPCSMFKMMMVMTAPFYLFELGYTALPFDVVVVVVVIMLVLSPQFTTAKRKTESHLM